MIYEKPLLFIDTNKFLEIYTFRNSMIKWITSELDDLHNDIITTSQVDMEFKKHRASAVKSHLLRLQKAIHGVGSLVDGFLIEAQALSDCLAADNSKNKYGKLMAPVLAALKDPTRKDPVYQCCQRLFGAASKINLYEGHGELGKICEAAQRRFSLGRPPRKRDDTSFGDAINWEWILSCAERTGRDVLIV